MMDKEARRKSIARRTVIYTLITVGTVVITLFLGLYTFGFRFDMSLNKVERTGLVQFGSSPSGAVSKVDGNAVQFRTPNKTVVNAGKHEFSMEREKYHTWKKSLDIKPGMLRWLNYAILVPEKIETEPVLSYEALSAVKATPEKKDLMVLRNNSVPSFELVDIRGNEVKPKQLDLPLEVYSQSENLEAGHRFEMMDWDYGGRYLLLRHYFAESSEWIVMDTQNLTESKNLTTHFDIPMTTVKFIDTSGNKFFVLNNTDVRKLDLSNSTISRPIVAKVESFTLYDKNYLAYIGQSGEGEKARKVVGFYHDGDKNNHIVKSFGIDKQNIKVAVTRYFNEDYVAILGDKVLTLLKGNFPTDGNSGDGLKNSMTLSLDESPAELTFSDSGQYLMMQKDKSFVSYDLEYQNVAKFSVNAEDSNFMAEWLDSTHLWAYSNGHTSILEFDGQNAHQITSSSQGFEVVFTNNKKYIYTINSAADGTYVLQRSLMILP